MNAKILSMVVGAGIIFSVSAWSQEQKASPELMARLERMRDETSWKVRTVGGGYKNLWLLHDRKLRRIYEQLQAGQTVDPKDLEELIKEHARLMP